MAVDLSFGGSHLITTSVFSWLLLLDAPSVRLFLDGLRRKLLEQGQLSDGLHSLCSLGFDTFQVIQSCKNWEQQHNKRQYLAKTPVVLRVVVVLR